MKIPRQIRIIIALILLTGLAPQFCRCFGQTNAPVATNAPPTIQGGLTAVLDAIQNDTNLWYEVHGLYGPGLTKHAGGGLGIVYNINDWTFANARLELIDGGLYMPQVTGGFGHALTLAGVTVKPFVLAGVGVPLGGSTVGTFTIPGKSGDPQAITGFGVAVRIKSGWDVVGDVEQWFPMSSKPIYRLGVAFKF